MPDYSVNNLTRANIMEHNCGRSFKWVSRDRSLTLRVRGDTPSYNDGTSRIVNCVGKLDDDEFLTYLIILLRIGSFQEGLRVKVGSKGHYGLLALAELADNYKVRRAVQVKEIASNQQIPLQYLGQIMVLLRRGHLVHAVRGPSGGYTLARPPETITVKEIITLLEGPAIGLELQAQMHVRSASKVTQRFFETWARGIRAMETVLEETTLADLCKPEQSALMYYI
jgi:Rrf2 family cysteine metabolism transcriptional repressor